MSFLVSVACPKCGAAEGERCRSLTTRRVTDTHVARFDAFYDKPKIRMPAVPEVCSCGNRFDGDNLCMISACEQET